MQTVIAINIFITLIFLVDNCIILQLSGRDLSIVAYIYRLNYLLLFILKTHCFLTLQTPPPSVIRRPNAVADPQFVDVTALQVSPRSAHSPRSHHGITRAREHKCSYT